MVFFSNYLKVDGRGFNNIVGTDQVEQHILHDAIAAKSWQCIMLTISTRVPGFSISMTLDEHRLHLSICLYIIATYRPGELAVTTLQLSSIPSC